MTGGASADDLRRPAPEPPHHSREADGTIFIADHWSRCHHGESPRRGTPDARDAMLQEVRSPTTGGHSLCPMAKRSCSARSRPRPAHRPTPSRSTRVNDARGSRAQRLATCQPDTSFTFKVGPSWLSRLIPIASRSLEARWLCSQGRCRSDACETARPLLFFRTSAFPTPGRWLMFLELSGFAGDALVWVDRGGQEQPTGATGGISLPATSRQTGTRMAVTVGGSDYDDVWRTILREVPGVDSR